MIVVYWTELVQDFFPVHVPRAQNFNSDRLGDALKFMEELRARRKSGEPISHVSMQSEIPESVGEAGVSEASADYDWYKRRIPPSTKLGRNSCDETDASQEE